MKSFDPKVYTTKNGTQYLKECGAALVARTEFLPQQATAFVNSFGDTFDAAEYENDWYDEGLEKHPERDLQPYHKLDGGASVVKFAGQTCYLSFGEKRTKNDQAQKYLDHIKESGHGSVLQHANYTVVIWGIDRACSHELVRHGTGTGYSQMSQRYVDGKTLRFVERSEYQEDAALHTSFEAWIDDARKEYAARAEMLRRVMAEKLEKVPPTERRKAVNQAARNCLPNETETAMVMTGNVRAWRHIVEARAAGPADKPIRALAVNILSILKEESPLLFSDYAVMTDADGLPFVSNEWWKV